MSPDVLRKYQAALGLTIVLALCSLFYGRAQALVPTRGDVTPGDMIRKSVLVSSNTLDPKTLFYNKLGPHFILTDIKVSLIGLPETGASGAVTDRVYVQLRVGSHVEDVDVTSFTFTGGSRVTQSGVASHSTHFQTGIVVPAPTYVTTVVKRQAAGPTRLYAVTIHGYYYR